jgi:hypothetical protein
MGATSIVEATRAPLRPALLCGLGVVEDRRLCLLERLSQQAEVVVSAFETVERTGGIFRHQCPMRICAS